MGYEVVAETNSVHAVETFCKDPSRFDVVITDQGMPDLTGLALSELLLKIRADVPIVLLTGNTENLQSRADNVGVGWLLSKPLSRRVNLPVRWERLWIPEANKGLLLPLHSHSPGQTSYVT
jgi:CheY-like chemotaxis protein